MEKIITPAVRAKKDKQSDYKIISSSASSTVEMDVITSMSDGSFNIGFFPNKDEKISQSIINKIINNIIKIKFIDENGNLLNPIPSIPRERFENIDEWKDSCGFFDEKNYSYKEVSMNFTKTIDEEKKASSARDKQLKALYGAEVYETMAKGKDSLNHISEKGMLGIKVGIGSSAFKATSHTETTEAVGK